MSDALSFLSLLFSLIFISFSPSSHRDLWPFCFFFLDEDVDVFSGCRTCFFFFEGGFERHEVEQKRERRSGHAFLGVSRCLLLFSLSSFSHPFQASPRYVCSLNAYDVYNRICGCLLELLGGMAKEGGRRGRALLSFFLPSLLQSSEEQRSPPLFVARVVRGGVRERRRRRLILLSLFFFFSPLGRFSSVSVSLSPCNERERESTSKHRR